MVMDSIELNNQIVYMRKNVKLAKVYAIRKLINQIKLLMKRQKNKEKYQRKIERLKEELLITRKLNLDKITVIALKENKNWNIILHEKNASKEERCIARLISQKIIQDKISKFYSTNPELQSQISTIVEKWEKKRLSKIDRIQNSLNKNESVEENENKLEILKTNDDEKIQEEKIKSENVTQLDKNKKKKQKSNIKNQKQCKISTEKEARGDQNSNIQKNLFKEYLLKSKEDVPDKIEGSMEILQINLNKIKDIIPIHDSSQDNANRKTAKSEKKLNDSFFLDSDGNDISDNEIELDSEISSDQLNHKTVFSKEFHTPKSQFITNLSSHHDKRRKKENFQDRKCFSEPNYRKRKDKIPKCAKSQLNMTSESSVRNKNSFKENNDINLHPSWEAKKKQQTKILPFEGKKIQFDIND